MKIAIYHNLEKGGCLNVIKNLLLNLNPANQVDVYSFNLNIPKKLVKNNYIFKLSKTTNIFSDLKQILFELRIKNKEIAHLIDSREYDLILIFPCILTQSPYILKYLKNLDKCIYFFNETKREFYEATSFNYWSLRKIISRIIRLPIKYIDIKNCKQAKHIISNSIYTRKVLFKIYKKKSTVIYPGLKPIKPKKIVLINNKKILSVGLISKFKGYDFSIKQLAGISKSLNILGRDSEESKKIFKIASKNNLLLNIIKTENDNTKDKIYKDFSIFLANQNHEPFGITTLEATSSGCYVIGKKEGGTKEIIKNGINGELYNNINEARNTLKKLLKRKKIIFYQINTIDWKYTTIKLLEYYDKKIKR